MPIFPSQRRVVGQDPLALTVTVNTGPCLVCGKDGEITLPKEAWQAYDDGKGQHIQHAWPQGTPAQREQLINGTHGPCFAEMFPPEDEEDTQNVNYANGDTP